MNLILSLFYILGCWREQRMTDEFQNQVKNSWSICRKIWSQCGETCFSLGQNRSCSTILWVGLRISNFGRGGGVACRKWLWVLKRKKYSVTRYGLLSAAPIFFFKMWVTKWGWYSSSDDKDFFLESIKIENRSFLSYLSRRFVNS